MSTKTLRRTLQFHLLLAASSATHIENEEASRVLSAGAQNPLIIHITPNPSPTPFYMSCMETLQLAEGLNLREAARRVLFSFDPKDPDDKLRRAAQVRLLDQVDVASEVALLDHVAAIVAPYLGPGAYIPPPEYTLLNAPPPDRGLLWIWELLDRVDALRDAAVSKTDARCKVALKQIAEDADDEWDDDGDPAVEALWYSKLRENLLLALMFTPERAVRELIWHGERSYVGKLRLQSMSHEYATLEEFIPIAADTISPECGGKGRAFVARALLEAISCGRADDTKGE